MQTVTSFNPAAFQSALATASLGRYLVYREVLHSTMDLAAREAKEGAPHGTLVFAEEQTARTSTSRSCFAAPSRSTGGCP
jgi:BirA family biotin operon repressor/biotin-[acetyl-CoA-carboxylase] ligase